MMMRLLEFTSGFSTAYKHYIFKLYNINPATDEYEFHFSNVVLMAVQTIT